MKFILFFISIFVFSGSVFAQIPDSTKQDSENKIIGRMPTWIGCQIYDSEQQRQECTAMQIQDYLNQSISIAKLTVKSDVIVFVTFIIDKSGIVKDPEILRGQSAELDAVAIRVISLMPPWNPGIQNDKFVSVQYNLPVRFSKKNNSQNKQIR